MMSRFLVIVVVVGVISIGMARASDVALSPGRYDVNVRLELPNLSDMGADRTDTICVTISDGKTRGLTVLSANNPLSHCPASNVRINGKALQFDIVCPGTNAAIGSAKYVLLQDRFEGSIAMKMGGKNMTMTEYQTGHRTGECEQSPVPPS